MPRETVYNQLIQRIHDHAKSLEKRNKVKNKAEMDFFTGYATALFDHGIITEGEYRTARDYTACLMRRNVKVDHFIIPFDAC
jgi:hypothetical protein